MPKTYVTTPYYPTVYSDYLDKVVYGSGGDDNLYGAYGNDRRYFITFNLI